VKYRIKEPVNLSERISWLREYYFKGTDRQWNNEFTVWSTGTPWDVQYNELNFYIVPENYALFDAMKGGYRQVARDVSLHDDFWTWGIVRRRAWFNREVMVEYLPQEILPGDLIAGGRFNLMTSLCLDEKEQKEYNKLVIGKKGSREKVKSFHAHGYGNAGATSGHIIPGYDRIMNIGWKGIYEDLEERFSALESEEQTGEKGEQLQAMMTAASFPRDLAGRYADLCRELSLSEKNGERAVELNVMADNLDRALWEPPETFWEAVQTLWLSHMLVMSDENYPGAGTSFGRLDQYLLPFWEKSREEGMDREFAKEILKCFWIHCNTAYDATIRAGNNGITAGFGQLVTLSGLGPDGRDMTNDLTYMILEVIDDMSPILEPKPNIRLHRGSPEKLLDIVTDMIESGQGAPFLLNFDERSMAGMILQAREAGIEHLINKENVHDYAPVGCLENTMAGNDRSGTVDNNLNLLKAVELVFTGGKDMVPVADAITGKVEKIRQDGPKTGDPRKFSSFEEFWKAYEIQTDYIIRRCVDVYESSESVRARFSRTPYLSCLVKGCAEKGLDVTQGGAEISFTTMEAVTYATAVDSLLAVKYLVFDKKICTMDELVKALKANWKGYGILQAKAKNKAPKYGRDEREADELAKKAMDLWCGMTWRHKTKSTERQYRPGMLSWNYWAGDGSVMAASADGRLQGQFLSNAICPSNGADVKGPTANTNSVGYVLGGKAENGKGDWDEFNNILPNGASHTITFNPSIVSDGEHKNKFKAFIKGYIENGGTALQVNMLDREMLKDAQEHPGDYRHLLVRITGYNAYFVTVGKELQDEVINRVSHGNY